MRQAKGCPVSALESVANAQPCEDAGGPGQVLMQMFSSTLRSFPQQDARSESHNCNIHVEAKGISFLEYFIICVWLPCPTGLY